MTELRTYGSIPINLSTVNESVAEYRSPKDKISALEQQGILIRLKNGLYVVSNEITQENISLELIANQLYGPSYISFESALNYYGLIPERVYVTRSAILSRRRSYNTPLGTFDYIRVPEYYFSVGLQIIEVGTSYTFMIARPEKALCDLIIATRGLRIQSLRGMRSYLFEDLRLDTDEIVSWDLSIIEDCIIHGYKRNELRFLQKVLENE